MAKNLLHCETGFRRISFCATRSHPLFEVKTSLGVLLSRGKKTGRQNHTLTQTKMLHCKTIVNIISITYHHIGLTLILIVIFSHFFDTLLTWA
jgi:hypothetical protein